MTFTRPIGGGDLQAELYFQRSSEPLTPQQLEDMAEADIINSASTVGGTKYGYRFITAQYLGTERLIPIGR